MRDLIQELLPHAPQMGLYVAPQIPEGKLRNALRDYAREVDGGEVLALYDATLLGSAKDGAVFTAERVVFQNMQLEPVHSFGYDEIVEVEEKRKLIGGRSVVVHVNRGRATFTVTMDFSGKADAAPYVARLLREAMLQGAAREMDAPAPAAGPRTDAEAVRRALEPLVEDGRLTAADFERLLAILRQGR